MNTIKKRLNINSKQIFHKLNEIVILLLLIFLINKKQEELKVSLCTPVKKENNYSNLYCYPITFFRILLL